MDDGEEQQRYGDVMKDSQVRWMVSVDLPRVIVIDKACFVKPWGEQEFRAALRQRNMIGMVLEELDDILGYMIYEILDDSIDLLRIATHPDHQGSGCSRKLLDKLKTKVGISYKRKGITVTVPETNLPAQLLFRAMGFKAVKVIRNAFDGEDGYKMRFFSDSSVECKS